MDIGHRVLSMFGLRSHVGVRSRDDIARHVSVLSSRRKMIYVYESFPAIFWCGKCERDFLGRSRLCSGCLKENR